MDIGVSEKFRRVAKSFLSALLNCVKKFMKLLIQRDENSIQGVSKNFPSPGVTLKSLQSAQLEVLNLHVGCRIIYRV